MATTDVAEPPAAEANSKRHTVPNFDDLFKKLDDVYERLVKEENEGKKPKAVVKAPNEKPSMPTPTQVLRQARAPTEAAQPVKPKRDVSVRVVGPPRTLSEEKDTTGPGWFDMPKTNLTPELKKDLQLIGMRDALDSKRFYKKDSATSKFPKYSQVGHIIEGSTEFYNARLSKKERKRTMVEEVLAEEAQSKKHKRKYAAIMAENLKNNALGRKKRRKG